MSSIGDWFEGLNSFSIESPQMSYFVAQPEIDDVFQLV